MESCLVVLSLQLLLLLPATLGAFPFPYDWSKFPAAWFGANATHFESTAQLDFIGKFSLAIFGWQHLITATNWTASVYSQANSLYAPLPCYRCKGDARCPR